MSNTINSRPSSLKISIDAGRSRQTPKTNFPGLLKKGLNTAANTASVAAPFIPGGAVLSAAVSGLRSSSAAFGSSSTGGNAVQVSGGSGSGQTIGATSSGSAASTGSTGSASGAANEEMDMMSRSEQLQEMNQQFNLEYLNLQQDMQAENRKFTSISNVMKTKHDTAKSTIQNVR